ncbi:heavy metal transport/detoxification superfamily protein [Actinidia rufa]|uniref:Heavy metal transport/detoxification superfamily protein n=1 Tax=Actinidia rufa TaxID=165716 RepID=A0A7J0EYX8_9ERIC|nr:heavy metal transport/detoxification superfamily protein [Actinidia rufa]
MVEKVTTMVLKVDLHCSNCYKKIKKVLCKFPQIRNQVYDDKANTVTITVVCCNPEKIRDKLCCKGGKTIKSIEIKHPSKPKEPEKPKEPKTPAPKPKPKPAPEPKPAPAPTPVPEKLIEPLKPDNPDDPIEPLERKELVKPKQPENPKETVKPKEPVSVFPVVCCGQCYEGNYWGPCYHGYGRPVPCYDGYGYHMSRCDYFNEENQLGCTIM